MSGTTPSTSGAPSSSGAAGEPRPGQPRRRAFGALRGWLLGFALLALWDWTRPPAAQWTARFELAAIHRYQAWLSPLLARGGARCRFRPTCSHYAEAAIARDGAVVGTLRAGWRIVRCGPWTAAGTEDPP